MTPGQLLQNLLEGNASRAEQHERVEPEVRGLLDEPLVALASKCGRHDLGGLLADLPADGWLTLRQETGDVRSRRRRRLARGDGALQTLEHPGGRGGTVATAVKRREEACPVSGVAGDAVLMHLDQQHVAVAVGVDAVDVLGVPRRLALAPGPA